MSNKKISAKRLYKIGNRKNHNSLIDSLLPQLVEIGDNFVSGPGSIILSHDASTFFHTGKYRCEKTIIGNNVFLGANATILPGVRIGNNVIIGAGAVIAKDIPDNHIAIGNPAKIHSSIDKYMKECEEKGVLFTPPKEFNYIFKGYSLTSDDVQNFQKKYLRENNLE